MAAFFYYREQEIPTNDIIGDHEDTNTGTDGQNINSRVVHNMVMELGSTTSNTG